MSKVDWEAVLALLPRWERLSPAARTAALSIVPGKGSPASALGDALPELKGARFARATGARGTLIEPEEEVAAGVAGLQTMNRVPVLRMLVPTALYAYAAAMFSPSDVSRALGGSLNAWSYPPPARLAARAGSVSRLDEFLALESAPALRRWAQRHLADAVVHRWDPVSLVAATQRLVRALLEKPGPVPLGQVAALLPGLGEREVAAVLDAATRLLFVFPTLEEDSTAYVGAWPPLVRRLRRPAGPPPPVEPAERFEAPWLLGDMTAVMVEAAAEPIRVRTDGALFVRTARAIARRLAPIPVWLPELLWGMDGSPDDPEAEDEPDPYNRVQIAAMWLEGVGLLAQRSARGSEPRLEPTAAGRAWLAAPERDRLAHVLDALRGRRERNPEGPYGGGGEILGFFSVRLGFSLPRGVTLDVRADVARALLALPRDGFVAREHFVEHRAREGNPFLGPELRKALRRTWEVLDEEEQWEGLWAEMVDRFLAERLAPLGGARLGRTAEGELCVGITSVGEYLLGAADDFAVESATETGAVVVQPDFEVVFLAPAPRAEAEIGRFADRTGSGVGATFRITRASVLRAAEAGAAVDEVLAVLREAASRDVPANVARQLRDWFGAVRRVAVRPAVVVECPDAETAARVLAAAGGTVEALSPTVLRLADAAGKSRSALVRKLRAAGIFVGEG